MNIRKSVAILAILAICLAIGVALLGSWLVSKWSFSRPQFELPVDWPVQELTLPAGTVTHQRLIYSRSDPSQVKRYSESTGERGLLMAFDGQYSFTSLDAHVEEVLLPLGYRKTSDPSQATPTARIVGSEYSSQDGKTEVVVFFERLRNEAPDGPYQTYWVSIEASE